MSDRDALVHGIIALRDAVLCVEADCEVVHHVKDAHCPRCGSRYSYPLAAWLSDRAQRMKGIA